MSGVARAAIPLRGLLLWQVWTLCWVGGLLASRWFWPACLGVALLPCCDDRLRGPRRLGLVLLCFAAGWGAAVLSLPKAPASVPQAAPVLRLTGRIQEVRGLPDGRLRVCLDAVRTADGTPLSGRVDWTWDQPSSRPLAGQWAAATLRLRSAQGFSNAGSTDWGLDGATRGVFWRLWSRGDRGDPRFSGEASMSASLREGLRQKLETALGRGQPLGQGQAFLPALLFSDRFHLSTVTMRRMAQATLTHSLALSGQHLALATLWGALLVWSIGHIRATVFLAVPASKLLLLLSLPAAALYLWLGDAPGSLVRAACMLALLAFWRWRNVPHTLGDLLLGAVLAISLAAPLAVFDVGLQLSVLCVGTIALCAPLLRQLGGVLPRGRHGLLRGAVQICCISLAIQVALLPVALLFFGTASPWFFLNLIWLPVLGCWVMPLGALGLAVLAVGADALASVPLHLAVLPCDALLWLLERLDPWLDMPALLRPHWTAIPAFALLLTAAALLPGRPVLPLRGRRMAALGVLLLVVGPALRVVAARQDQVVVSLLEIIVPALIQYANRIPAYCSA